MLRIQPTSLPWARKSCMTWPQSGIFWLHFVPSSSSLTVFRSLFEFWEHSKLFPAAGTWQLLVTSIWKLFPRLCVPLASCFLHISLTIIFLMLIYFEKERERESESTSLCLHELGRGRGRGRERIPSRFHAVSAEPDTRLHLTNHEIMTWTEIRSQTFNLLERPGASTIISLKNTSLITLSNRNCLLTTVHAMYNVKLFIL